MCSQGSGGSGTVAKRRRTPQFLSIPSHQSASSSRAQFFPSAAPNFPTPGQSQIGAPSQFVSASSINLNAGQTSRAISADPFPQGRIGLLPGLASLSPFPVLLPGQTSPNPLAMSSHPITIETEMRDFIECEECETALVSRCAREEDAIATAQSSEAAINEAAKR